MRPPRPPSPERSTAKVGGRARKLERRFTDSGAIKFDFDNQGGYLEVTTNDSFNYSGVGDVGILFDDQSGEGIILDLHDGSIIGRIAIAPASIVIRHNEVISLQISGGAFLSLDEGSVGIDLTTGGAFEVRDNGGNPIFRVDEDGDVHIKAGKTITADL